MIFLIFEFGKSSPTTYYLYGYIYLFLFIPRGKSNPTRTTAAKTIKNLFKTNNNSPQHPSVVVDRLLPICCHIMRYYYIISACLRVQAEPPRKKLFSFLLYLLILTFPRSISSLERPLSIYKCRTHFYSCDL